MEVCHLDSMTKELQNERGFSFECTRLLVPGGRLPAKLHQVSLNHVQFNSRLKCVFMFILKLWLCVHEFTYFSLLFTKATCLYD
jgi:hypothetical protein